jgi:hypothetical protein
MVQAGQLSSKQLTHAPIKEPMTLIRLLESVSIPFKRIKMLSNIVKNGIMDYNSQIKVDNLFF